jgi:putative salt-induced outer membrane protein YdiY
MRYRSSAVAAVILSLPWAVAAQDAPAAVAQHQEGVAAAPAEEETDVTDWDVSAGAVLTTGNTESFTANAGSRFRLVRLPHSVEAEIAYILGLANDGFADKTAENLNFRLRYDYFFDPMNAIFLAGRVRQDDFAGLAPRLQGQVGYLRNFFLEEEGKHRFWGEIGYDITYDRFNYDRLDLDPAIDPATLPSELIAHSARIFLGYENAVSENLVFRTGLEVLVNVDPSVIQTDPDGTEHTGLEDVRLTSESSLRVNLVGNLLAELKLRLQFDNLPPLGAQKLDTTTQLNLVYTFL